MKVNRAVAYGAATIEGFVAGIESARAEVTKRQALTFTDTAGEVIAHFSDAEITNIAHHGPEVRCTVRQRPTEADLVVRELLGI